MNRTMIIAVSAVMVFVLLGAVFIMNIPGMVKSSGDMNSIQETTPQTDNVTNSNLTVNNSTSNNTNATNGNNTGNNTSNNTGTDTSDDTNLSSAILKSVMSVQYSRGNYQVGEAYVFTISSKMLEGFGNVTDWLDVGGESGISATVNNNQVEFTNGTGKLMTWISNGPNSTHSTTMTMIFSHTGEYQLQFYELCRAGHPVSAQRVLATINVV